MKLELIRFEHDDLKLEVNVSPSEETVWLSLDDMAMLFGRDRSVIGKHVKMLFLKNVRKIQYGQNLPELALMGKHIM